MSNSHLFLPSGFIRTPLQNGLGRYIPQLQRITLKFCKSHGGSRGVRDFIESDLMEFAKTNPGTVVYLKPRRHRSPCMVAEYLNGEREYLSCHEFSRDEVYKWLSYMCTRSGIPVMRFRKYQHTDYPTIQGVWNPFTHQAPEINVAEFPHEVLSKPIDQGPTATEQLIEIFKKTQMEDPANKPPN
uniref:Large ribosomal subunit protein mL43 n=1 Tax=Daphnia similis TaxID=35528 RepID=A0A4Y7N0F6_9CRUS|nr:EOG090X0FS9 [Daphnia similis]SVE87078.1 EOG090X0FS9 [Daphnia similis]SVE87702.1 EOG090X0FS9 [Daphnia similis]